MLEVDPKALGRRIRQRRTTLGLSQPELARRVGMKQQGIGSLEAGAVKRPTRLKELATFLQTTDDWLLYGVEPEIPEPERPSDDPRLTRVPLISWVSAGRLVNADAEIPLEDIPLLVFADLGPGEFFATRVVGDSMDRLSPDKSLIVVNRRERRPEPGKPFLFALDGETTFKLWEPDPARLEPFSTNPLNKTIFIKRKRDLEVIGRVRRTVLDL